LALSASSASAVAFIDLRWDDCNSTETNKDWNCVATTGNWFVIASFDPGVTRSDLIAEDGLVDVIATNIGATVLPAFWQFNSGGCNQGRMTFSSDFSTFGNCVDTWGGLASGGGQFGGKGGPQPEGNTARIKWSWFVVPGDARTITDGQEHYVSQFRISRSAAAVACAGCADAVCMVYNQEQLAYLSGPAQQIIFSTDQTNPPYITWQNSANDVFNCPIPTPVRQRTWGEIKSLYR
jgi:hypothetical protein